jgi:REP element-mobilizing transposase RayT
VQVVFESDFDRSEFPLAYLITIRCYGTWLHGDERVAVDRHGLNVYGRRRRLANTKLEDLMRRNMKQDAFLLSDGQRTVVKEAINEVCDYRQYDLWAINVLTSHFHAVVSAQSKPEPIADAFKSYSTRKLRAAGLIDKQVRPWARGKSRRYLRKPKHVSRAIDYVLYGQGDIPDFDD